MGPVLSGLWSFPVAWPLAFGFAAAMALAPAGWLLRQNRRHRAALTALRAEVARLKDSDPGRNGNDAFHRAYYNNTSDSLFVMKVEDDGRFTVADRNPAHEATVGGITEEVMGKELHEFVPAQVASRLTEYYRRCVDENGPIQFEMEAGLENRMRRWETVLVPIHDATGKITHIMGASRDITDRWQLEEKLRQGQKMEALGQLTGGIAHDFNNLLTVVMGNLDMLKRAREERRSKLIDNSLQAVERARELTQKLLAFGRRQALRPEPTDLKTLIAGMDDMLMQSLRGDIRLELDLPDDLWPVEVDQAQLQVALINLAANARDAMPRAGILRVRAENAAPRDGEAGAPFEGVAISVTDTGHGMSPEVVARAFDPFFTTKEVGRGTGLGLAQVYGFAQQSGGSAEIRSEVGAGTTVTLYLPRALGRVVRTEPSSTDFGRKDRALRILLVEDNVQVAEVAASILREHGHDVTTVHSADDAVDALEDESHFEFVFSDLVMPGELNGLDLARIVRSRWPELPILLATGYSEAGGRASQEGFTLIPKPYRASMLVEAVQRVAAEAERDLAESKISIKQA